jgi:hypothetical protein
MAKRTQQGATKERQGDKGRQMVDAVELLSADHRRIFDLFDRFESLEVHGRLKEEFFYPALEKTAKESESARGNGREEAVVEMEGTAEEEEEDDMDEEEMAEAEMDLEDILAIAREEHEAVKTTIGELRGVDIAGKTDSACSRCFIVAGSRTASSAD